MTLRCSKIAETWKSPREVFNSRHSSETFKSATLERHAYKERERETRGRRPSFPTEEGSTTRRVVSPSTRHTRPAKINAVSILSFPLFFGQLVSYYYSRTIRDLVDCFQGRGGGGVSFLRDEGKERKKNCARWYEFVS